MASIREGSLEAPTRHALDWKNEAFYDEAALQAEMERIFDICHGCRRCVNLCGAFPTLFDLVDEGPTGEVDGVPKEKYADVVDQCYLCDMCYLTKCPYVPPHEWNVDFPHTMLRAKAVAFRKTGGKWRDRVLSSTDGLGKFAGIPIVTQAVNALNRTAVVREAMQSALGVDKNAWVPDYAARKFRSTARDDTAPAVRDGERTPGKVAIFATCYVNYNEPGIGEDLLEILRHNDIPYEIVEKEACCGMPKFELGDLASVEKHKDKNIPVLLRYAEAGYAILSAIPSCTLMFKQELPLLFAGEAAVRKVGASVWDPFEYLMARYRDGLLKTDFKQPLGKVSYHIPCHGRVQNIGRKTEEMFKLLPETTINTVERCSGHAGTWGVKKAYHAMAMKIGRPVFRAMAKDEPDFISSDCQLAGHHIEQGMGQAEGARVPELAHPLTLLRRAYGI
ncbi:heterodisulfide reductase-related iron-sulfur binding cluster [Pandoraea sp.]|uniref:heterodisulfide reductase-related iron-sulfur binding cluster n=1 Tax=Pandoraea sp. TaxID=1883445 RepID=UPI00120E7E49|nr:heterodisulfide reductase-related iron-sulfur binding cluster [Pandoraea sp.]TAL53627.1 MAG: Fe-S oxidoreductase [Pandoraea sp.]TAM14830.1 MAG: Fe-S oxidoreductase [Pandoraea sp.]